jgi:NAD(P)-dependent dehydrogenase (short-subunit alcohol dehydrogenase family)
LSSYRRSAALEVAGSGIRVNAVALGPVETGMLNRFTGNAERKAGLVAGVPMKRVGEPKEIASAILSLPPRRHPSSRDMCFV